MNRADAAGARIDGWAARLSALCREMDADMGTDAVILMLVALAGQATRRSGRPVEHVVGVFREMLRAEFGQDLLVVDAREPEPGETVQ